jgi:hypothetical protein
MKKFLLAVIVLVIPALTSCAVYYREPAYTPVERPSYYVMRVYDDRYVFYSADEPVAVWTFEPGGLYIKQGIDISGPVRVYYQPDVLFAEAYYVNGYRDGPCRYYYPGGGVMYSGYYNRGYLSGTWTSYNSGGVIAASVQFHGTETVMSAGVEQQASPEARIGFQYMQRESAYAGKTAVRKPFDREKAVPPNYQQSFGAMPARQAGAGNQPQGTMTNAAQAQQGNKPGAGEIQAQAAGQGAKNGAPAGNQPNAVGQNQQSQPALTQAGAQGQQQGKKGLKKLKNKKQFNGQNPVSVKPKNSGKHKQNKNRPGPAPYKGDKNLPGDVKDRGNNKMPQTSL